MRWLYELRDFVSSNPLIWGAVFVLISVVSELIIFVVIKKAEDRNPTKKAIIVDLVICASITAIIAALFNLFFLTPTIENDSSVIPKELTRKRVVISLGDYYGEYYYPPNNKVKNYFFDDILNDSADITLYNKDYNVTYNSYSISQESSNFTEYVFADIPTGNYTLTIEMNGYLKHVEELSLGYDEESVNFITGETWWLIKPIMKKNDNELTYAMSLRFLDSNETPIENLKYELISNQRNNSLDNYGYPNETNSKGEIEETINIQDNKEFWIAYINPYSGEKEVTTVYSKVDKNYNKCDAILIFDSAGVLSQTSPNELWYQ